MPIPDLQTFSRPFLEFLSDGKPRTTGDAEDYLAEYFQLSASERQELLPSGKQPRFRNRISLAVAHLKQARYVEPISRGVYQITERGHEMLKDNSAGPQQSATEILESTYQRQRGELSSELLGMVRSSSDRCFMQVVSDLLRAMGYREPKTGGVNSIVLTEDGEVSGTITGDKLGLGSIFVTALRSEEIIGTGRTGKFCYSLENTQAERGLMIVTGQFLEEARETAATCAKKITLLDGNEFANLLIDRGIGVAEMQRYVVKRVDGEYFREV